MIALLNYRPRRSCARFLSTAWLHIVDPGTSFLASRALENVPDIRHSDRGMNGATTLPLPTNSDARLLTGYLIPIVVQVGLLVLLLG